MTETTGRLTTSKIYPADNLVPDVNKLVRGAIKKYNNKINKIIIDKRNK